MRNEPPDCIAHQNDLFPLSLSTSLFIKRVKQQSAVSETLFPSLGDGWPCTAEATAVIKVMAQTYAMLGDTGFNLAG